MKEHCPEGRPRTIFVAQYEGGDIFPFKPAMHQCESVHAIYFEDGTRWDAYNGWNGRTYELPARYMHMNADWGDGFVPTEYWP